MKHPPVTWWLWRPRQPVWKAFGECVHAVVLGPLVADLAPPHLLGRYISLYSLTVTGGLALGPAVGGAVLATSPDAIW